MLKLKRKPPWPHASTRNTESKSMDNSKAYTEIILPLRLGNVRALVLRAEARQILRLLCRDSTLRNEVASADDTALQGVGLDDNAFDDNVRVYLKEKSKVNVNI